MWPLSAFAAQTLRASHTVTHRITAYTAVQGVVTGLPFSGGSVRYDTKSQVRRKATLDIADPTLWPLHPLDALSPVGTEIGIEYGINVPGQATEWVTMVRGPITQAGRSSPPGSSAAVSLSIADRSAKVAEARFERPTQTRTNVTLVSEIQRLIREVLPDVSVVDETGSTRIGPQLDIERERWADGIEKLADALGAEVFCDRLGDFIIRPQPTLDDQRVWTATVGEGGVVVTADEDTTRERIYNKVVASGQRSDGTPPVWAEAVDDAPESPTRWGGPFGKKPRFYVSPVLSTTEQCQLAANAWLARVTGMVGTVSLSTVPNPALDVGDVLAVDLGTGRRQVHIIDAITTPLTVGGTQSLETRSLELPPEQGGEVV